MLTAIFGLGIALAGLAGVMSAPLAGVQPAMGIEILTAAFVVVVIGGLGSFWGVVVAGLLVGVVRGLTVFVYPPAAEASMYALMVLVLLLRPRGLMGEKVAARMTGLRLLRHPLLVLAARSSSCRSSPARSACRSRSRARSRCSRWSASASTCCSATPACSFGHGAFFGLAAYAAALFQLHLAPGSFLCPSRSPSPSRR